MERTGRKRIAIPGVATGPPFTTTLDGMHMLSALWDAIFGGPTLAVRTLTPADEAVRRLSEKTADWKFPLGLRDTIVGSVAVDRVVLSRVRPVFNFAGAPVFRGRFVTEADGTYLKGQFQLDPISKTFMAFWFGGVAAFCVGSLILGPVIAAEDNGPIWLGILLGLAFALAGVAFGAIGYLFLRLLRWLSSSDLKRIMQHIETHAGDHAA